VLNLKCGDVVTIDKREEVKKYGKEIPKYG